MANLIKRIHPYDLGEKLASAKGTPKLTIHRRRVIEFDGHLYVEYLNAPRTKAGLAYQKKLRARLKRER